MNTIYNSNVYRVKKKKKEKSETIKIQDNTCIV